MALSTGLELVLNAAEGPLQILLTENGDLLCAQEWHRADRATEILAPALQELCARLGISLMDVRRIACVRGPGSFTGIRLVLTTAAALRRVTGARLAALDYMQALATSAVMARGMLWGGQVHVLTHARRNLVHYQPFMAYGPVIPAYATAPVQLMPPQEALKAVEAAVADRAHFPPGALPFRPGGHPVLCPAAHAGRAGIAAGGSAERRGGIPASSGYRLAGVTGLCLDGGGRLHHCLLFLFLAAGPCLHCHGRFL